MTPQKVRELMQKRRRLQETAEHILETADEERREPTASESKDIDGILAKMKAIDAELSASGVSGSGRTGRASDIVRQMFQGSFRSGSALEGAPAPFGSFGEQLQAVIAAGTPGQTTDQRLFEIRAAAGMNETVASDGGFMVQRSFSYDLLAQGMNQAKIAPRCREFPIPSNANGIKLPVVDETSRASGSRWGGIQLSWTGEAGDISASKTKIRKVELELKKLTGACYLTDELVQDAATLETFVRTAFAEEFGFVIDDRILRGTGAGQPLGILGCSALVVVLKVGGQSADTIITDNIVSMYARSSNPEGSVWLCNIDLLPQLITLSLPVGTGGAPVGLLKDGIAGSPSGLGMLGRPVIWCEQCSALGDEGDIVFADLGQYLLATKGGLQIANSIHVRFLQDESVLRFIYRVDGQPAVSAAKSPYKGSLTKSPFVTLEAR